MLWRCWPDGRYKPVDLYDTQSGAGFLVCPGPSLKREPLDALRVSRLPVIAVNSAIATYDWPQWWVTLDSPAGFPPGILANPRVVKCLPIKCYRDVIMGKCSCEHPSTLFYDTSPAFDIPGLLAPRSEYVHWKNTFFVALQLAYRLGFRRLYLVGVDLEISAERQYAHGNPMKAEDVERNQRLYTDTGVRMAELAPHLRAAGLTIYRCNAACPLPCYDYRSLGEAIGREAAEIPPVHAADFQYCTRVNPIQMTTPEVVYRAMRGGLDEKQEQKTP